MKNIFLVRHGQKHNEVDDPGLTELGKRQATEVGKYFKNINFDAVVVSPLRRTKETAKKILEIIGGEFKIDTRLVERMEWTEEITGGDFMLEWVKATSDRDYVPRVGSSSRNSGKRIENLINTLDDNYQNILLVTHGGVIMDYLRNVFGDEALKTLKKQYEAGEDFEMSNCSINKVVYGAGIKLELLNYTNHLVKITE